MDLPLAEADILFQPAAYTSPICPCTSLNFSQKMSRFCVKKDNKENKMQTPLVEEAPPVGIERSTAFEISNLKEKQNKGSNEN